MAAALSADDLAVQYSPLAWSLAWKIAWNPADVDDLFQYGMQGLIQAFRSTPVQNESAFAERVLRSWMQWYYKPADREDRLLFPGDDALPIFSVDGRRAAYEQTFIREYLQEVDRIVGPTGWEIAMNLLTPTPPVVMLAMRDMAVKASRRAAGERVRGADTLVIKHDHIRRAMNLGENEWYKSLQALRSFTRDFLAKEASAPAT